MTPLSATLPGLLRRGAPVEWSTGQPTLHGVVVTVTGNGVHVAWPLALEGIDSTLEVVPFSDLVLDLDEPGGCDVAARWLASRVGMSVGTTAPSWIRVGNQWALVMVVEGSDIDGITYATHCFVEPEIPGDTGGDSYTVVPGISVILEPKAALAAACKVGGGIE